MIILNKKKWINVSLVTLIALLSGWQSGCAKDGLADADSMQGIAGKQNLENPAEMDMQSVIHTMHPFNGASHPAVDTSSLEGKVMCGYQGWFTAEGDGAARGWTHWKGNDGFKPGSC